MKGFPWKCAFPRKMPKVLTLLSPRVNVLCIIKKRVTGVLQPTFFSCHRIFIHITIFFWKTAIFFEKTEVFFKNAEVFYLKRFGVLTQTCPRNFISPRRINIPPPHIFVMNLSVRTSDERRMALSQQDDTSYLDKTYHLPAKVRWQERKEGGRSPATRYSLMHNTLTFDGRSVCKFGKIPGGQVVFEKNDLFRLILQLFSNKALYLFVQS